MDGNTLITLIIAGFVVGTYARDKVRNVFKKPRADKENTIEKVPLPAITPDTVLSTQEWLQIINDQPDKDPHIAIVGGSGSGKTTIGTAILAHRKGQVVIFSAKEGDTWAGLPYYGIDIDATYTTMRAALASIDTEVKRRLVATKQHKGLTDDWLTVVVDDFSTLLKEAPIAADIVKLVARIGRALRVRLIMLTDSQNVKAIGLEGEGESRSNFVFINLRKTAKERKAVIKLEDELTGDKVDVPMDTGLVKALADRAQLSHRQWKAPRDRNEELSDLLGISTTGFTGSYTGSTIENLIAYNPDISANEVHRQVGGNRQDVLRKVKQTKRQQALT